MSATRNSNSAGPVSPPPDTTPAGKAAAPQNTVVEGTAAYKQPKLKPPKINGRAIKFDSKGPPKWGQQVHPPGQQAQYDDLIDDGIDQGRVIELMTMPERFETDGFGQRLSAAGVLPKRQAKEGFVRAKGPIPGPPRCPTNTSSLCPIPVSNSLGLSCSKHC